MCAHVCVCVCVCVCVRACVCVCVCVSLCSFQMVAKGKDCSDLFPAVVKNVVSKNSEVIGSGVCVCQCCVENRRKWSVRSARRVMDTGWS